MDIKARAAIHDMGLEGVPIISTRERRPPSGTRCENHQIVESSVAPVWCCIKCGAEWVPDDGQSDAQ